MRWDRLFDDLEAQLESGLGDDAADERGEAERSRIAALTVRDRLVAAALRGVPVALRLVDGGVLDARIRTVGADWITAEAVDPSGADGGGPRAGGPGAGEDAPGGGRTLVVPLAALAAIGLRPGDGRWSAAAPEDDRPEARAALREVSAARVGVGVVLRDLCRRRTAVGVRTMHGRMHGTIDRVGRDHLDLAVHDAGSARLRSEVRSLRILPLAGLIAIEL